MRPGGDDRVARGYGGRCKGVIRSTKWMHRERFNQLNHAPNAFVSHRWSTLMVCVLVRTSPRTVLTAKCRAFNVQPLQLGDVSVNTRTRKFITYPEVITARFSRANSGHTCSSYGP